jgi:tetratricopeptide (TPR) repeat protein
MEPLKTKTMIAIIAILFSANAVTAQTFDEMQKAFKASYVSEYKANYNSAINDLQKVCKDDSYVCNLRLGWLNYSAKKYEKALEYYQKAITLKQYSVEARSGYIATATALKRYTSVYNKYEEILKIDPYNSTANYWVGVNYYNAKKYDIAAKYFELVVNMYPFDYDANHMLGWTYLSLGRTSEAKILFEKALLFKPGNESAKSGLSKCN